MIPRPHQSRAVEWTFDTWASLRSQRRRTSVVVQLPTGGGKTFILDLLKPDLVIAPGVDLVRQLSARIEGARVETIQGLARRYHAGQSLPQVKRIAVDEARLALAPRWMPVVEYYLNQGAEVVLTDATPATADGRGLGVLAEDLYQAATMRELIDAGYLVPFKILSPDSRTDALAASPLDAYRWQTPGESAIIFAENKAHAAGIVETFTAVGISAALITDDTSERQRSWVIQALGDGTLTVAVCAQILRQGIDVPRVSSIILARAVGSYPLWMQAIGRGARPHEETGKVRCTVLDLRGAFHGHGHPETPMVWGLDGTVKPLGEALPVCVQCRNCGAWGTGGGCRICLTPLPPPKAPRIKAKDLIEQRATQPDDQKKEALFRYVREAVGKGHKPYSAVFKYKGVFGSEPPSAWFNEAVREAHSLKSTQGSFL